MHILIVFPLLCSGRPRSGAPEATFSSQNNTPAGLTSSPVKISCLCCRRPFELRYRAEHLSNTFNIQGIRSVLFVIARYSNRSNYANRANSEQSGTEGDGEMKFHSGEVGGIGVKISYLQGRVYLFLKEIYSLNNCNNLLLQLFADITNSNNFKFLRMLLRS